MLVQWSPYRDMSALSRMFDEAWRGNESAESASSLMPRLDICETEQSYHIEVDMPGINPENLEVKLEKGLLTVVGRREERRDEQKRHVLVQERRFGTFVRSLQLGADVDADKVQARFKDGVVAIEVPKRASSLPRQIPVTQG